MIETIEINPKKDFHLYCPPHCDILIKEGIAISVPEFLISNLITEKIIDIDDVTENVTKSKTKSKTKKK